MNGKNNNGDYSIDWKKILLNHSEINKNLIKRKLLMKHN